MKLLQTVTGGHNIIEAKCRISLVHDNEEECENVVFNYAVKPKLTKSD